MESSKQNKGLEAINLNETYDNTIALNNFNVKVSEGKICYLLGQNSAGKTTTINIFSSLIKPTSGEAVINSASIKDMNYISKEVTYLREAVQLYRKLSGPEEGAIVQESDTTDITSQELQQLYLKII